MPSPSTFGTRAMRSRPPRCSPWPTSRASTMLPNTLRSPGRLSPSSVRKTSGCGQLSLPLSPRSQPSLASPSLLHRSRITGDHFQRRLRRRRLSDKSSRRRQQRLRLDRATIPGTSRLLRPSGAVCSDSTGPRLAPRDGRHSRRHPQSYRTLSTPHPRAPIQRVPARDLSRQGRRNEELD